MMAQFPDLKDKSVFITGGGSGIGAALTDGFMAQGARVAFVGRSDASDFCDAQDAKHGRRPLFIQCDITDIPALKNAMAQAKEAHGPVTALVNNAANAKRHDFEEIDEGFYDWMMAVNLKAYAFACQAVLADMRKSGGGAIVNFTSISYMMGNPGYQHYTTANSGINGMTRSLAREYGPDNIRVNALAPGWVMTQKQKDMWANPKALAAHLDRQCLKEHVAPEDIVGGTLFLASVTSKMMTGQSMVIDGGVVVTG